MQLRLISPGRSSNDGGCPSEESDDVLVDVHVDLQRRIGCCACNRRRHGEARVFTTYKLWRLRSAATSLTVAVVREILWVDKCSREERPGLKGATAADSPRPLLE
jgi:hypothetical protein